VANDRLRDALLRQRLTPSNLAEELQVDAKTVERWITLGRLPYGRHRHKIAARLQQSEAYLWPDALSADRAAQIAASEIVQVFPSRAAVPSDLWRRLLDDATERIGVLVYSGLFLPEQHPRLNTILREKGRAGVRVRLLLGDPDSAQVAERGRDEGIDDAMASKIRNVMVHLAPLRRASGVEVRLHATTLYNSLYWFDEEMLVNTHVYGLPGGHAPVLHLRRLSAGELFDTYAESFERVWARSRPAWASGAAA
jgi:hypothetical protein